jgi:ABC-type Zn uptake system ZnuABC Zn-binding protein ZnuA
MKRLFPRLFVSTMILVVALPLVAADKLKVVTTTMDLASIITEVGGEKVDVTSIAKGYQDPHFVDAKPSFLLLLRKTELLAVVGLELEVSWLPPLVEQSRNTKIRPGSDGYLDMSRGVEILDRPGGTVNRSMGDVHAQGNPHYWLDPANVVRMAIGVRDRLVKLRPGDKAYFDERLGAFKTRLDGAHKGWAAKLAPYKNTKIVTYHRSWTNFVDRYNLDVIDFVEPKPGVPPSPVHIFNLVKTMKANGVKVILVEPYFDLKTPNSIAEKAGATVVVMYPSVGGQDDLDDYFKVFDRNINALASALR